MDYLARKRNKNLIDASTTKKKRQYSIYQSEKKDKIFDKKRKNSVQQRLTFTNPKRSIKAKQTARSKKSFLETKRDVPF